MVVLVGVDGGGCSGGGTCCGGGGGGCFGDGGVPVVGGVDDAGVDALVFAVDGVLAWTDVAVCADWSTNGTRWPRIFPGKLSGFGKSPPLAKRGSRTARDMNLWKMVAGSDPPLTLCTPCTSVI